MIMPAVTRFAVKPGMARGLAAASMLAAGAALPAAAGDLVSHNGFEACWSKAISEQQFLGLEQSAIDGVTTCVPLQDLGGGLTACDTAACSGSAIGCPVTSHAGAFTGTFAAGTSEFSATGSADDFQIHTSLGCSITVSNVGLTYTLDYTLQADGNNGLDAASLDQSTVTVASGYVLGGTNVTCASFAGTFGSSLLSLVQGEAAARVLALETPATVGESVCPLTP
jgi:hypothetical protein